MQVALILGATRGLGKAIVNECQQRHWFTLEVGSSIEQYSTDEQRALCPCDLGSPDSVHQLITRHLRGTGTALDHFFWVAGQHWEGKFSEQREKDIVRLVDVNFRNSLLIAHWAWESLLSNRRPATFTVVASTSGVRHRNCEAVYVATKFAQVGFTRSLGLEAQSTEVRVSLFLPGGMNTDLLAHRPAVTGAPLLEPDKVAARMLKLIEQQTDPFAEHLIERGTL